MIVSAGKEHVAALLADTGAASMSHMAIGSTGGTTLETETELSNELLNGGSPMRADFATPPNSKIQGADGGMNTISYTGVWPAGVPDVAVNVREAGIFNAATGGVMLCKSTGFGVKGKGIGDSLTFKWVITVN